MQRVPRAWNRRASYMYIFWHGTARGLYPKQGSLALRHSRNNSPMPGLTISPPVGTKKMSIAERCPSPSRRRGRRYIYIIWVALSHDRRVLDEWFSERYIIVGRVSKGHHLLYRLFHHRVILQEKYYTAKLTKSRINIWICTKSIGHY